MRLLPESAASWNIASQSLRSGKLVCFPTDTVYGLGCDPFNVSAIKATYVAKGRDFAKPLPLLLGDVGHVADVSVSLPESARLLVEAFWPGALTLVLPRHPSLPVELGGGATIAVRVPNHTGLRGFIESSGGAVAATSANRSGEPDAVTAEQAAAYLGAHVEVVIDGGASHGGVPSTVVDCTGSVPKILRLGALSEALIQAVLERSPTRL